jgi:hypothetical protein
MALSAVMIASRLKSPEARARLVEVMADRTPWTAEGEQIEIIEYVIQAVAKQRCRNLSRTEISDIRTEVLIYLGGNDD